MSLDFDTLTEEQRQKVGEALWSRERPRCQSALVDELVREQWDGFGTDDLENMYPDPSEWGVVKCYEYLRENGGDEPDGDANPYTMDRAALVELLTGAGIECRDDETDATLRAAVIANMDDETIDGLDEWQDAVRDNANPAEPLEWWEVGDWLAERLARRGEVVIRNGYGDWWGRQCSGQAVYLDDVIQRLGAEYAAWALKD